MKNSNKHALEAFRMIQDEERRKKERKDKENLNNNVINTENFLFKFLPD